MDLAHLVNDPGIKQDPFSGCGFASVNMGRNPNISDSFQGIGAGHGENLRRFCLEKTKVTLQVGFGGIWWAPPSGRQMS
jgi:hypothetical protein